MLLALAGRYDGKRVYLKIDEKAKESDLQYQFDYLTKDEANDSTYVRLSDLLGVEIPRIEAFISKRLPKISGVQRETAFEIVAQFIQTFAISEVLLLHEIKERTDFNDVLEIFHRVNSGGIQLSRSDLLFSTVTFALPDMEAKFLDLLDELNDGGRFEFDIDFLVKAVLVIFGMGAKYDAQNLKNKKLTDQLRDRFGELEKAMTALREWLVNSAQIRSSRFVYSNNALIPLLDYMMLTGQLNGPRKDAERKRMVEYLYMSMFTRVFSYSVDNLLDQLHQLLVRAAKESKDFPIKELRDLITRRAKVDSYKFRDEYLQDLDLVLNCIQPGGVDQIPKKRGWSLERDHIFPKAELERHKIANDIDDVGNLRFLPKARNIAKSDTMPDSETEFFGTDNKALMKLFDAATAKLNQENYSRFANERKKLIRARVIDFLGM